MRFVVGLLLAMLALPGAAQAQSSQKPLQIIVPFAPGGSADGIGRILATELSVKLGRQVYVENKPGAGGSLGLTVLAKAAPDGDTVAIAATGALVINPHVPGSTGFDPVKELAPVAKLIEIPLLIVANPKTGPKTVKEMIEQSSKLQALLEADRDAMTALREHLRRFTSDTDRLCSEMIERHEATVDQADKVPA